MSDVSKEGLEHHEARGAPGNQTHFRQDRLNVLLVTGGHPFAREAFFDVFDANPDINWSHVDHPAAQLMFAPRIAKHFDCYVLYDMPGIEFRSGDTPIFHSASRPYREGLRALGEMGLPFVVLHHAAAAWPSWSEWSHFVGAQFLYQPAKSFGETLPDSGYALEVSHTISAVGDHPITSGVGPFTLTDELYLWPGPRHGVTPILVSDFDFTDSNFYSAARALEGKLFSREGWRHRPGSNVVGWTKTYNNSPLVYLQFGDGPSAYRDGNYRTLLARAINWAASQRR